MMVKGSTKTDKGRCGWKPGHAKANKGCLWAHERKIVKKIKTYLMFPVYKIDSKITFGKFSFIDGTITTSAALYNKLFHSILLL